MIIGLSSIHRTLPRILVIVSAFLCPVVSLGQQDRPNLIFIMADDLGYGDLGCYGQKKIQTPSLDRMAAEGMRFTQFYAGSTVCAPSRCVLMTGRHTGHAWVRGNAGNNPAQTLRDEDVTVAEVFKQAGYATALFGKWGLGEQGTSGHPNRQGFDTFFGYLNQRHAHNYYPPFLWWNEEKYPLNNLIEEGNPDLGDGWAKFKSDYSHDIIFEKAMEWLADHKDTPFFLYLPFTIPHANNEANRGTGNGQEVPEYGIYADLDWSEPNKGQAAMISRMDRDVGVLLDRLREWGLEKKTLVVFTSDNGHHREGGNDPEFFDANGPLRGMKRDLYEGGIRVPTLAYWPGTVKPSSESDHIAYFGDLMALACEMTGRALPEGLDSISFLPTLRGDSFKQKKHEYLYWEFYEQGSRQAVRQGKWKAIRQPMYDGELELYDLSTDLGEKHNLVLERKAVAGKMAQLMDQAHRPDPKWKVK